jgi:hypothetical protein
MAPPLIVIAIPAIQAAEFLFVVFRLKLLTAPFTFLCAIFPMVRTS